jgi:hypothetical protein
MAAPHAGSPIIRFRLDDAARWWRRAECLFSGGRPPVGGTRRSGLTTTADSKFGQACADRAIGDSVAARRGVRAVRCRRGHVRPSRRFCSARRRAARHHPRRPGQHWFRAIRQSSGSRRSSRARSSACSMCIFRTGATRQSRSTRSGAWAAAWPRSSRSWKSRSRPPGGPTAKPYPMLLSSRQSPHRRMHAWT